MQAGELRHRVTLENPGARVSDGDGGYTTPYAAFATRLPAAVAPATARDLERVVANSVQSSATHLVTLRYLAGVTTKTQVVFHDGATDRRFGVSGVQDPDERHVSLTLACEEVV